MTGSFSSHLQPIANVESLQTVQEAPGLGDDEGNYVHMILDIDLKLRRSGFHYPWQMEGQSKNVATQVECYIQPV